jgi:hypothetical protein
MKPKAGPVRPLSSPKKCEAVLNLFGIVLAKLVADVLENPKTSLTPLPRVNGAHASRAAARACTAM